MQLHKRDERGKGGEDERTEEGMGEEVEARPEIDKHPRQEGTPEERRDAGEFQEAREAQIMKFL